MGLLVSWKKFIKMVQIETKTISGKEVVKLSVTPHIGNDSGSIWYKLFDANHALVTEGNIPIDMDFIDTFNGTEIMAANYVANYLGVIIL